MKQKISFFTLILLLSLSQSNYGMLSTPTAQKRKIGRDISEKRRKLTYSLSRKQKKSSPGQLQKKLNNYESCIPQHNVSDIRLPSLLEEHRLNNNITIDPQTINCTFTHGETFLIWAAYHNKISLIQELMKFDNLLINKQDNDGNTALHCSASHKNITAIKKFLLDPRTDASISNKDNKTARNLIQGSTEADTELRRIIFARIMLDMTVNNTCKSIRDLYYKAWIATMDTGHEKIFILQHFLTTICLLAIDDIKSAIIQDQDNQNNGDRNLPDSAKMPQYATDKFIAKMLFYRLIEYK